jgi:hypothetical protein
MIIRAIRVIRLTRVIRVILTQTVTVLQVHTQLQIWCLCSTLHRSQQATKKGDRCNKKGGPVQQKKGDRCNKKGGTGSFCLFSAKSSKNGALVYSQHIK